MMTKWNANHMEILVHRLCIDKVYNVQDEHHGHMYIIQLLHTAYLKKLTTLVHTVKFPSGT